MRILKKIFPIGLILLMLLTGCSGLNTVVPETSPSAEESIPVLTEEEDDSTSMDSNVMDSPSMDGMESRKDEPEIPESKFEKNEEGTSSEEQQAIDLLAAETDMAAHLANYPDWEAYGWPEEEFDGSGVVYGVEFVDTVSDEWLGWGIVDIDTGEIHEIFVPRELSVAEYQEGRQKVETIVLADAEVLAILGDPNYWESEVWYNRWESNWEMFFWRGLDEIGVAVYMEDDWVDLNIFDPSAFEAEEQEMLDRNQAIELAWEANGIEDALSGVDDWVTYVESQGGSEWTVTFVSGESELFFAYVDIEKWVVLEASR